MTPRDIEARIEEARSLLRAKQAGKAEAVLEELIAAEPGCVPALDLLSRSATARKDSVAALKALRASLAAGGPTPARNLLLGVTLRRLKLLEEALPVLQSVVAADPHAPEAIKARRELVTCLSKLGRHSESLAAAEASCEATPEHAPSRFALANILHSMERRGDATREAKRAIELDPTLVSARSLLQVLQVSEVGTRSGDRSQRWMPWPSRVAAIQDLRGFIKRSVLRGYPSECAFINPTTTFMTLGSCFAQNLANRLRATGLPVYSEFIGEGVNSTYANRHLLSWVEHGVRDGQTQAMENAYGEPMREKLRTGILAADVFVFTLGVAPSFFHKETGEFFFLHEAKASQEYLFGNYRMRTTTVAENVENIREIIGSIRRISSRNPRVVLTVSPVPLGATAEMQSAVIADCVSKSVMRVACHEIMGAADIKDVDYWPSFEIVRWLSGHFAPYHPPAYGMEDGNSRHVSAWIVDVIIDLFLETYTAHPRVADAAAA